MTATDPSPEARTGAELAPAAPPPAPRGAAAIEAALPALPPGPGVYRMLDARGEALYVGKARSLRKRVASYAATGRLPERLRRMVADTASLDVVVTRTEAEALLLESNMIKRLRPRFNIILKDDKSFPWLLLTADHAFPQVLKHRGAHSRKGSYFGPFASAWAVNQTLTALQRAFLLRSCSDPVFESRTRPCLLHQIKRCSAPCVGRISVADYAGLVEQARAFLRGETAGVQRSLAAEMEQAAAALEFERAALLRDRIRGLTHVQQHQDVNPQALGEADVIALFQAGGQSCVQVFFVRGGRNNGNRAYFPAHTREAGPGEVLAAFLGQFYDDKPPPRTVLVSHAPPEQALIAEALAIRAGRRVELACPQRGGRRRVVEHALLNAREALERRLAEGTAQAELLDGMARVFGLPAAPERIEVYDNSHTMGREPYGVMVVAGPEGFRKPAYRSFRIKGKLPPGDDHAMLREVLTRRFGRALREDPDREGESWPDLVLVDGGAGQLAAAQGVLAELGVADVALVAIAKGPDRDAGRERFFQPGREPFALPPRDPVLYFLQRLRDEAHRFAIGAHRSGRGRAMTRSALDELPGVGPARKKALLHHFGSARGVAQAGLADLAAVPGVSHALARRIYEHFHPGVAADKIAPRQDSAG